MIFRLQLKINNCINMYCITIHIFILNLIIEPEERERRKLDETRVRDMWPTSERESHARERERERAHVSACGVAWRGDGVCRGERESIR